MFTNLINKTRKAARIGKHQMSKKNAKHPNWKPSKGEQKDINNGKWGRAMFMKYGIGK